MPKCPMCQSQKFYIQDPEDEYEISLFTITEQGPDFEDGLNADVVLYPERKVFCDLCTWHGTYAQLQNS